MVAKPDAQATGDDGMSLAVAPLRARAVNEPRLHLRPAPDRRPRPDGLLHRPVATLRELVDSYVAQYDAAPSTVAWLKDNTRPALYRFGDEPIAALTVERVATWRATVPEGKRYRSHRALRQVLHAAVRWRWIDDNPAVHVKNPEPRPGEIHPFEVWEELDAIADELEVVSGVLVTFLAGTGVRPEESFGAEWRDVDLERRMFMVRRAFAKARLKEYGKTTGSRRAVPPRTGTWSPARTCVSASCSTRSTRRSLSRLDALEARDAA